MVKCSDFSCRTRNIRERLGVAILKTDPKQLLYKSRQVPLEEDDWNGDVPPAFTPITGMDPCPGRTPMFGLCPKGIIQILCSLMAPRSLIWQCGGIWTLGLHWLCTTWWAQSLFLWSPILGTRLKETVPNSDLNLRLAQEQFGTF